MDSQTDRQADRAGQSGQFRGSCATKIFAKVYLHSYLVIQICISRLDDRGFGGVSYCYRFGIISIIKGLSLLHLYVPKLYCLKYVIGK